MNASSVYEMTKEVATASMAIAAQVANADGSISDAELNAVHTLCVFG